jgi:hypothetical protein
VGQNTFFPLRASIPFAQQAEISVYGEKVYIPLWQTPTIFRSFTRISNLAWRSRLTCWAVTAVQRWLAGTSTTSICTCPADVHPVLLHNFFLSNQIYLQILFGFVFFRYELPMTRVPRETYGAV